MASTPVSGNTVQSADRVRVRGRQWIVDARTPSTDCAALRLREIGRDHALTLLTPFDRPSALDRNERPRVVRPRRWLHDLERALLALHSFGSLRAAATSAVRLLPYQLEPALLVAREGVSRVLIADGVGLGKTIQAGLILRELAQRDDSCRALVLSPAGLRDQWRTELSARLGLPAVVADSGWLRSSSSERPADVNPWSMPGIYVASHDLVKRPEVLRPIEDVTWDAVVIDEAHAATSGTDRRAALDAIARRSRHVILLTATPHEGDAAERYALCRIGQIREADQPLVWFQRSRIDVGGGTERRTRVQAVVLSRAERRMHDLLDRYSRCLWEEACTRGDERGRLVSIVLRKRGLSSAASLAISVDRRLALLRDRSTDAPWQQPLPLALDKDEDPLDDDVPATVLAAPGLVDAKRERQWLQEVADAAWSAARHERKVRFLLRFLSRLREPVIVFTEYRDTLMRLAEHVTAAGNDVVLLHGGMSAADRVNVQRTFNERGATLLATDAASEGLNLHQRCRVVVHFELPWNPSRLEQRAGRIDRFGQTRTVHEIALVAAHTAERLVVAPLLSRRLGASASRRPLVAALTESAVAAAVMTDRLPPAAALEPQGLPPCTVTPPDNLSGLAAAEAAQLEERRRIGARSSSTRYADAACRASLSRLGRRPGGIHDLYLVFAVSLETRSGTRVHAEPLLLRVELQADFFRRSDRLVRQELQNVVARLARGDEAVARALVRQHDLERFDHIATMERDRATRLRQRDEAIAEAMAVERRRTSQQLVQAGLFDRRSLRAARRHATSIADLDETRRERAASYESEAPEPRPGLIAALLRARRP